MYIYVDVFLCVNILLNTLLLSVTAKLYGARLRWLPLILASGCGSVYALGYVYLDWGFLYSVPIKFVASLLMIYIAFRPQKLIRLLRLTVAYYVVCFVTGGAVAGWYYYRQSFISALIEPFSSFISWPDLLGGASLAVCLLLAAKAGLLSSLSQRLIEYQVDVVYSGRKTTFTAIVDTGNSLYSVSRKPVIVADYQAVQDLFSQQTKTFFAHNSPTAWLENLPACEDKDWLSRVEVIPFLALGGKSLLIAFRPDMVTVRSKDSVIETSNVVIGVYAGTLSARDCYSALLHPAILQLTVHKEVNTCVSPG